MNESEWNKNEENKRYKWIDKDRNRRGDKDKDRKGNKGRFRVSGWEGESTTSTPPVVANDIEVPRHWDFGFPHTWEIGNSVQYYEPTLVQWFGLAERWVDNADQ